MPRIPESAVTRSLPPVSAQPIREAIGIGPRRKRGKAPRAASELPALISSFLPAAYSSSAKASLHAF